VLSLFASAILSGILTQATSYYVPSILIAPAVMALGEALMTTFNRDTPPSQWIAYQFLSGFGLGFGMQTSALAIQTVLPKEDVSNGIAINFFLQQLGGAISTSIGQAIISNVLFQQLSQIPDLDSSTLLVTEGATYIVELVKEPYKSVVLNAFNFAFQRIFLVAVCMAFFSLLCALGMEWRAIKKPSKNPDAQVLPGGADSSSGIIRHDYSESNMDSSSSLLARHGMPSSSSIWQQQPGGRQAHENVPTGVPGPDDSDPLHTNNPLYGGPIAAPVVFVPHSGDPEDPYGQMAMHSPTMYGNPTYYQSLPSLPAIAHASAEDMHPLLSASSLVQTDRRPEEPLCRNCRYSIDAAEGMQSELSVSGTTNRKSMDDEEMGERRY